MTYPLANKEGNMAQERLSMRKIREVLRLKHGCGLANRAIARSVSVSHDMVRQCVQRAAAVGMTWPLPEGLDDAALYERLFPRPERAASAAIPLPDWTSVHAERAYPGDGGGG